MDFATLLVIAVFVLIAWWIYRLSVRVIRFLFSGLVAGKTSTAKKKEPVFDNATNELHEWNSREPEVNSPERPLHSLRIKYKSAGGQITVRFIDVVDTTRRGYIEAYCHLRNDHRTFNLASVISCIDLATGETVEDLNKHLGVAPSIEQQYQITDKFIAQHKDELAILLYVGKADGRLMRPERLLIAAYLETQTGETNDKLVDNAISYAEVPSLAGFKRAVGRVSKENKHALSHLYDVSKKIVATQKKVAASEQEALDYIRSRLGTPA